MRIISQNDSVSSAQGCIAVKNSLDSSRPTLDIKARPLKCCPFCGTVQIRHRTRKLGYVCQICGAQFQQAQKKVMRIHGGTNPKFLKIALKRPGGEGMNPQTSSYAELSEYDKFAVKASMKAYNKRYPRTPFFEVDEFYEKIYSWGGLFL